MSQNSLVTRIYPQSIIHYGFENANDDYEVKDIPDIKVAVIDSYTKFILLFTGDRDIRNFLQRNYSIQFSQEIIKDLLEYAPVGFDQMEAIIKGSCNEDAQLNESVFFWCLKETLYQISTKYWNR